MAVTAEDKREILNRSNEIRDKVSRSLGWFLDKGKSITGAAADEFSWFLGGDVSVLGQVYGNIYFIVKRGYGVGWGIYLFNEQEGTFTQVFD